MKQCTVCHSPNVRRSGVHVSEAHAHPFRSPYRCLDCDARFWVISRRARVGAAAGGAIVIALVAFIAAPALLRHHSAPADPPPAAYRPAAASGAQDDTDTRRLDDILRLQSGILDQQLQVQNGSQTVR